MWHLFFVICLKIRDNDHIPKEVCRMCDRNIGENQSTRTTHRAWCLRRMKCYACKQCLTEIGNGTILGFCCHVILCVGDGIFMCPNCSKQDTKYGSIYKHHLQCTRNVRCMACNQKRFANPQELKAHINEHHKMFKCKKCSVIFLSEHSLQQHIADHAWMHRVLSQILCVKVSQSNSDTMNI